MSSDPSDAPVYRSLAEQAKRLGPGRNGRPCHAATLTRWITQGCRTRGGGTIKLAARRMPGRWLVTDEALTAFFDAITRDRIGEPAVPAPSSAPAAREKAIDRAEALLEKAGV
jgi:hypothetical protein